MERLAGWVWRGVAGVTGVFLILPLIALGLRALNFPPDTEIFTPALIDALFRSAATTTIAMGVSIVFGTPLAYLLARRRFRGRGVVRVLVELPIVLPPAVAGIALLFAYGERGLLGGTLKSVGITLSFSVAAVILAQIFVAAPFFIRSAQTGFAGVPPELEDAGRVDGADGIALFWYITLPLAAPNLFSGLILAWARALGEFGATILFAGSLQGRTQTMPLLIYNALERDVNAAIVAGLILVGVAVIALLTARWLQPSDTPA